MTSIDQYRIFIDNLQNEDQRPQALNDLKTLLSFTSPSEAMPVIRDVGIAKILECLNVTDKTHLDLTCEVLKICFDMFDAGDVVRNYISYMMYLLRHDKSCVRQLAIDVIYKAIASDVTKLPVPNYIDVFVAVSQMVCEKDVAIANKAILITSHLPDEAYPKVLEEMQIALQCNSSSKCNAFEIFVNISTKSQELFALCASQGYFDFMVKELESDDILYQLNILELLSQLIEKPYAMSYFVKHGALRKIVGFLQELRNNQLGGLLTTGYIKFFGCVTYHYSKEVIKEYPMILEYIFESFDSADQSLLPVVLDTLGIIGSTMEGKLCLVAYGSIYTQTIEKVAEIIKNSPSELKLRALNCFVNLIGVEQDPVARSKPIDHRVTLMTREWFRSLSKQPSAAELLFELCKNPFPDLKFAAFNLLDAVCQHQWGEELVANTAGFIEFLLDRTMDNKKELKEVKYDIIKRLSTSSAFDDNTILKLQTYVDQGPFYSEPQLEVAMEDD
ncbi:unnamed protein product [Leptidea sinapis]|uniref:26S proteasome non-ATPase regulatory subunit 5 n=1 Tax=Leptidea sinapis TaxID=189913 RepID=A0A5E4R6Z2_9NEOP|nr:unnamed protein product [Leptidea sinapis]